MQKIVVKPSPRFRRNAAVAIFSIVLFILVYLLLVASAFGILALCVIGAFALLSLHANLLFVMLAGGMVSLGILVVIFLFKFLFEKSKIDRSHLVELDMDSQPELKDTIKTITAQIGTKFPKRVYLSHEVNASVFYDSSLLSLLFPASKNLHIGLGLASALTTSEFKAVLAHEFGHFSQSSMKLGSYVYYVNSMLYNLLYQNDGYQQLAVKWASVNGYFSFFVNLAMSLVQGAQWILKGMYSLVNKKYLALSREMEFHADEIAARVAGGMALVHSFDKSSPAEYALHQVLAHYDKLLEENRLPQNLHQDQRFLMRFFAEENEGNQIKTKSEISVKDQWSSHPSEKERIDRLIQLDATETMEPDLSATSFFTGLQELEERVTAQLYRDITFTGEPQKVHPEEFQSEYTTSYQAYDFPKIFKGYYFYRNPGKTVDKADGHSDSLLSWDSLFGAEPFALLSRKISLESDIQTLNDIAKGSFGTKTFDFKGKRHKKKEAVAVRRLLEEELKSVDLQLDRHDQLIYLYFLQIERNSPEEGTLAQLANGWSMAHSDWHQNAALVQELRSGLAFVQFNTPFDEIRANFRRLTHSEMALKSKIKETLENQRLASMFSEEGKKLLEQFVSKDLQYFSGETYNNEQLDLLFNSMYLFDSTHSRHEFALRKELLEYMASLEPQRESLSTSPPISRGTSAPTP